MIKKQMFKLALGIVAMMLLSSQAFAAAVFKVSHGKDYLFIGGTIHILTKEDFPLSPPYQSAFAQSDELIFETDIAAFNDPAIMMKIAPVMMQPKGKKLSEQLSEQTASIFKQHILDKGLAFAQFDAMSATGAMLTLTMMEFQAQGFLSEGVDAFYHAKGIEQGKGIAWLESVDTQIALLDSFDNGDPDALIAYTLAEVSTGSDVILNMHDAWKSGDLEQLEALGLSEMKRDFPDVYKRIMLDRNMNWMPQIEAMLSDDDIEYVLVGALHLVGEDGLLNMLSEKGFTIERL